MSADDQRPTVTVTEGRQHIVVKNVISCIARDPCLYQSGGFLVHIVPDVDASDQRARVRQLSAGALRDLVSRSVNLERKAKKRKKGGEAGPADAPPWLLTMILELHRWDHEDPKTKRMRTLVRPLAGVRTTPFVRADGAIVTKPGYDPATRLFLDWPGVELAIAARPTREDAVAAAETLCTVVRGFPFKNGAHRSVFLSALLSVVMRPAIDGPIPLHFIEANVRGAGKSLLADVIALIATGRVAARESIPESDAEFEKRTFSMSLEPLVLYDNIRGKVDSQRLELILTSEEAKARMMNSNDMPRLPQRAVFLMTGNNASIGGDLGRRMLMCRLESPHEHPEERKDVAGEAVLKAEVRRRRTELLTAALTMVRAWYLSERPSTTTLRAMGSFSGWSDIVRQIIVHAGQLDPGETIPDVRDFADQDAQGVAQLYRAWHAAVGAQWETTSSLLRLCWPGAGADTPASARALRDALDDFARTRGGQPPRTNAVGRILSRYQGRIVGSLVLERREIPNAHGTFEWRVRELGTEPAGTQRTLDVGPTDPQGSFGDGYDDRDWSDEKDPQDGSAS